MSAQHPHHAQVTLEERDQRRILSLVRKRLREMVEPFDSTLPYWSYDPNLGEDGKWEDVPKGYHTVDFPPLIDQIRAAVGSAPNRSAGAVGYESKSPAVDDAIVLEMRILKQCSTFLRRRVHVRPTRDVVANLREMERLLSGVDDGDLIEADRLVRSWWIGAKVHGGHEGPPYRPHAHCPECDSIDTLRLRMSTSVLGVARCVECGADWDDTTIRSLLRVLFEEAGNDPWSSASDMAYHQLRRYVSRGEAQARDVEGRAHWCSVCSRWHPGKPRGSRGAPLLTQS